MIRYIVGVKFGGLLIAFNLLLLVFIFFPPIYFVASWAVNGHLLGREYLEMVGFRRMDPPHLRSGLGERGGPPEIVKTANPELFNQLLGGK